jgi:hypothetical protein
MDTKLLIQECQTLFQRRLRGEITQAELETECRRLGEEPVVIHIPTPQETLALWLRDTVEQIPEGSETIAFRCSAAALYESYVKRVGKRGALDKKAFCQVVASLYPRAALSDWRDVGGERVKEYDGLRIKQVTSA